MPVRETPDGLIYDDEPCTPLEAIYGAADDIQTSVGAIIGIACGDLPGPQIRESTLRNLFVSLESMTIAVNGWNRAT